MNTQLPSFIRKQTVSLKIFSKNFTNEQKKISSQHQRYYEVLLALKLARKKQGITQEELAVKAKIPRTTVTKIESGKYNPTLHTLMSIASAMNKKLQVRVV